jgi:hypothetical protein
LPGTPGPFNAAGTEVDATLTNTDFVWSDSSDAMDIDVVIETPEPARDGYFWAYQFAFTGSPIGGFVGLQMNGRYQPMPPTGPFQTANMAVFWIGGPPVRAELGDFAPGASRTFFETERGQNWWSINALYDVVPCRTYHLRVAREGQEANGDIWYGAWVRDVATSVEKFLGRILVPAAWGQLSTQSSVFTNRIGWSKPSSCAAVEYVSARFGTPSADATMKPFSKAPRFGTPINCPTSRISDLGDWVRHELAVP